MIHFDACSALRAMMLVTIVGCHQGADPVRAPAPGPPATANGPAPAPVTSPSVPPPAPTPFRLVAELPDVELSAIRGALVGFTVTFPEDASDIMGTARALVLRGSRFEQFSEWPNGMLFIPQGAVGTPSSIDIYGVRPLARGTGPEVLGVPMGPYGGEFAGLVERDDGALFGLQVGFGAPNLVQIRGKSGIVQQKGPTCERDGLQSSVRVFGRNLGETAERDILLAGRQCDGTDAVEIWKGGRGASRIVAIDSPVATSYIGLGGAFLVDESGGLQHYEGETFSPIATPLPDREAFPLRTADGRLFAWHNRRETKETKAGLDIWQLSGQDWKPVTLPEPGRGALLYDGERLWLAMEGGNLYAEGAGAPERIELTLPEERRTPPPEPPPFRAPGPKCDSHVVVLFGFTKVTPVDYDFPLTRKALKGHKELEGVRFAVTRHRGERFFVALTPSFEMANKVAKVIKAGVGGSSPQVVCGSPEIEREVAIDLATGAIKAP